MPILQDEIWRKAQKLLAAGRMRSTLFGYKTPPPAKSYRFFEKIVFSPPLYRFSPSVARGEVHISAPFAHTIATKTKKEQKHDRIGYHQATEGM